MSQLKELLTAVKDKNLSKEQIDSYRYELIHLFSAVCIERADLKKKEAFYFMDTMEKDGSESDVSIKRKWRITPEGQRLLDLEAYKTLLPKEIDSLRSRIYSLL